MMTEPAQIVRFATPDDVIAQSDTRLVDVVDRLLDAGIVVRAELWLTVADVELVFLGADLFFANPDSMSRRPSADAPRHGDSGARSER